MISEIKKPHDLILDKRLTSRETDYLCVIAQDPAVQDCTELDRYLASWFDVPQAVAAKMFHRLEQKGFIKITAERTVVIIVSNSRTALFQD